MVKHLKKNPIISAIKNDKGLKSCLESDCQVVFILYGDVCSIKDIVDKVKSAKKMAIVHIDFITGLSNSEVVVDYLAQNTKLDGIISTKYNLLKAAKERDLIAIQRVFLIDSISLTNLENKLKNNTKQVDFIEILPGVMPKILKRLVHYVDVPIIAGGLIIDEDDIEVSLEAGALAVSTTDEELWD